MQIWVKVIYLGNTRGDLPVTLFVLKKNSKNLPLRASVWAKRKIGEKLLVS